MATKNTAVTWHDQSTRPLLVVVATQLNCYARPSQPSAQLQLAAATSYIVLLLSGKLMQISEVDINNTTTVKDWSVKLLHVIWT